MDSLSALAERIELPPLSGSAGCTELLVGVKLHVDWNAPLWTRGFSLLRCTSAGELVLVPV